jgi:hypothetical protein
MRLTYDQQAAVERAINPLHPLQRTAFLAALNKRLRTANFEEPDDHAVWVPARASLVRDDIHQTTRLIR